MSTAARHLTEKTYELIEKYGDQAYHKATELAAFSVSIDDNEGAEMFAEAAIELLQIGYHKNPRMPVIERVV